MVAIVVVHHHFLGLAAKTVRAAAKAASCGKKRLGFRVSKKKMKIKGRKRKCLKELTKPEKNNLGWEIF